MTPTVYLNVIRTSGGAIEKNDVWGRPQPVEIQDEQEDRGHLRRSLACRPNRRGRAGQAVQLYRLSTSRPGGSVGVVCHHDRQRFLLSKRGAPEFERGGDG